MKHQSLLLGLLAVLLWSTVATAFKLALTVLSPTQLLCLSVLVSAAALWLMVALTGRFKLVLPAMRNQGWLFLTLAVINPTLYYQILFNAYALLPAQVAQPINYTWALVFAWLAVPFLKQKLTRADVLASIGGYLGVVLIATQGQWPWDTDVSVFGVALALLSTLLWAAYWLINTKARGDAIVAMALIFSLAIPMVAISLPLVGETLPTDIPWGSVVWVGLFEMGVTFVLWQLALKKADNVSHVSNLIFLSPILSLAIINAVLGEDIHLTTMIGLAIILTSVFYQQMAKKRA